MSKTTLPIDDRAVALLIEDDGGIRYVVDTLLSKRGYRVVCGASVAEGLRLLAQRPKWIILDIRLPDGSGMEVLRAIRREGLAVRVAVITSDPTLLPEAEGLAPDKIWVKPLIVGELLRWMEEGEGEGGRG